MPWPGKEEATQRGISYGKIKQSQGRLDLVKRKWKKVLCLQQSDSRRRQNGRYPTIRHLNINKTPLSLTGLQDSAPHGQHSAAPASTSFSSDTLQG